MQKKYFFLIGLLGLLIFLIINNPDKQTQINTLETKEDVSLDKLDKLGIAGFWTSGSVILINASADGVGAHNWTWAVAQAWCSGAGIEGDPYLIENLTITVNSADAGLTILSNGSFFTLNNITIANAGGNGLYLDGNNGTITGSVFNSNGAYGIYMLNANFTTISDINCSLNTNAGIYMENCVVNTIDISDFDDNTEDGMVMANCTLNEVSSSYFLRNTQDGLTIEDSDLNNFTVEADDNNRGLVLIDSDECIIDGGEFWDNTVVGVLLEEDDGDTLDNLIYNNLFSGNGIDGADNSTIANDWDNGSLGNNWGYYAGALDADDDGIGDTPYTSDNIIDNYPIYSDGDEPVVDLDDDDDADELFKGEKNVPLALNNATIILIVLVAGVGIVIVFLLYTGGFRSKIKVPSRKRIKGKIKGKF